MKCRGRPKCPRRIGYEPLVTYFKPTGIPMSELEVVSIAMEELEALRLVDLEGLQQEEAAFQMGISRRSFWEDLQSARKKVSFALTTGRAIEIKRNGHVDSTEET
jgi:hypothetical protein